MDIEGGAHEHHHQHQQQGLLSSSHHNHHIAYRNFVHSIKSPTTRKVYIRSLRVYMNWLSIYDDNYDAMLQKDSRLIASDIIDFIIYLRNEDRYIVHLCDDYCLSGIRVPFGILFNSNKQAEENITTRGA